jgi:hypothetical protein
MEGGAAAVEGRLPASVVLFPDTREENTFGIFLLGFLLPIPTDDSYRSLSSCFDLDGILDEGGYLSHFISRWRDWL